MKIKLTILTENDIPASALNGIDEEQIKSAWQSLLDLISVKPTENNDRATVLSAEFVEEEVQPEIIHCRDCKHRGEKPIADGRYWCSIHMAYMHYCSDAERRTEYGKRQATFD